MPLDDVADETVEFAARLETFVGPMRHREKCGGERLRSAASVIPIIGALTAPEPLAAPREVDVERQRRSVSWGIDFVDLQPCCGCLVGQGAHELACNIWRMGEETGKRLVRRGT